LVDFRQFKQNFPLFKIALLSLSTGSNQTGFNPEGVNIHGVMAGRITE